MKGSLSPQWLQTIREVHLDLQDNTTGDLSTSAHGFAPKAPNDTTKYLRGDGSWAVPPQGVGSGSASALYPAFTTPILGDFTAINSASAVTNANGGIYLEAPAGAGQNVRAYVRTAPSTPYTITAAFLMNIPMIDFPAAGLLFRESGTGELITLKIIRSTTSLGNNEIRCSDMTGPTDASPVTNLGVDYISFGSGVLWLQLADDGANRHVRWSTDGYNFINLFSEGRTVHLTADQVGFFANAVNATWPVGCTLLSWAQT